MNARVYPHPSTSLAVAPYARIKQYLKDELSRGRWPPGAAMPSDAELVAQFGVSRMTVTRALNELRSEGLIERVQGVGIAAPFSLGGWQTLLDMPPGIFKMINGSKFMRYHHTVPQAHLDGRVHDIPQGNVLGGGSSVNAQVYMRGRPSDYDAWHERLRGDNDYPGWGWSDVLPHFRGMEGNNRLDDERHGTGGPLLVSDPGHIDDLSRWFVESVQALGVPLTTDFNGPTQNGVGFYQFMNRQGKRSSAAYAFIAPLAGNPDLTVRLNAAVRRIEIERGRAVGVTYRDGDGSERPMEAMIAAVSTLNVPGQCNEGFLRKDALLVVTFITDEEEDRKSVV